MVNNKQTKDIQEDENLIDELTWFEWIYWFCAYIIASVAPHESFPVKNVYLVVLRRTSLNVVVKKVEGVVRWPSGGSRTDDEKLSMWKNQLMKQCKRN